MVYFLFRNGPEEITSNLWIQQRNEQERYKNKIKTEFGSIVSGLHLHYNCSDTLECEHIFDSFIDNKISPQINFIIKSLNCRMNSSSSVFLIAKKHNST